MTPKKLPYELDKAILEFKSEGQAPYLQATQVGNIKFWPAEPTTTTSETTQLAGKYHNMYDVLANRKVRNIRIASRIYKPLTARWAEVQAFQLSSPNHTA